MMPDKRGERLRICVAEKAHTRTTNAVLHLRVFLNLNSNLTTYGDEKERITFRVSAKLSPRAEFLSGFVRIFFYYVFASHTRKIKSSNNEKRDEKIICAELFAVSLRYWRCSNTMFIITIKLIDFPSSLNRPTNHHHRYLKKAKNDLQDKYEKRSRE
jgi:hypothetical protein